MGARRNMAGDRIGWIDGKRRRALHRARQRITVSQHKARHAIGQCRLADTCRAADQPGMGNATAAVGIE